MPPFTRSRAEVGQNIPSRDLDSKERREFDKEFEAYEHHREETRQDGNNGVTITDPLAPAREHGHEPSKGAKTDAQLQAEDQEELRRKGKI